jgi:hypothetical protein
MRKSLTNGQADGQTSTYKNSSIGLWKGWLKILVKLKVKIKALLML